ncbi:MAG: hypothetical protein Q7S22_08645 [Candidatus Micrarchaeota archaeon]|nr:hypothetical protein [Candidatus Micrarchaeota archaeon]
MSYSIPETHTVDIQRPVNQPLLNVRSRFGICDLDPKGDIAVFLKSIFGERFLITNIHFRVYRFKTAERMRLSDHRDFYELDPVNKMKICPSCNTHVDNCKYKGQTALVSTKSTNEHIALDFILGLTLSFERQKSTTVLRREEVKARNNLTITADKELLSHIVTHINFRDVCAKLRRKPLRTMPDPPLTELTPDKKRGFRNRGYMPRQAKIRS